MSQEKEFQERVRRIGALVGEIEAIADPAVRTSTRQLVQLVMEFHGTGLDRTLEILANGGEPGMAFIEQLGRDPMVGSLLVLYGLHPESLETRVSKAVERLKPKLRRDGASIELLGDRRRCCPHSGHPGAHACGSTTKALQSTWKMRFTKPRQTSPRYGRGLGREAGRWVRGAGQADGSGSSPRPT